DLHSQLTSNGTADDYMTAALLYQKEAQRLKSRAQQLEQKAQAIEPIQDPKGIRRNGLLLAAQEARVEASTMEQLYATHRTKAETMMGMRQQE
ncbi:MAG: hypothetical protein ACREI3_06390, partial [Nitrospirales bacterium]